MAFAILGSLAIGPALSQERKHDNRNDQGQHDNRRDKGQHDNRHDNRRDKGHDNRNQNDASGSYRQGKQSRGDRHANARFNDRHRQVVRGYYDNRKRHGHYRHDKARRYQIGRPLPRDVIFYEVPRSVSRDFGAPPRGYRYVRVSNDILLISAITGLVIDALQN